MQEIISCLLEGGVGQKSAGAYIEGFIGTIHPLASAMTKNALICEDRPNSLECLKSDLLTLLPLGGSLLVSFRSRNAVVRSGVQQSWGFSRVGARTLLELLV